MENRKLTQAEYTILEGFLYRFFRIPEGVVYNGDMTLKLQDGKLVFGTKLDKEKVYRETEEKGDK